MKHRDDKPRESSATSLERAKCVDIIVNDRAGTVLEQGFDAIERAAHRAAKAAGLDVSVHRCSPQSVSTTLERLVAKHPERILVGGGDGTLSTAANIFLGTDVALGTLPFGTCNFVAQTLRVPVDPEAAVGSLLSGGLEWIDLGQVNDRAFINAVTLGIFMRAAKEREKRRRESNDARWSASSLDIARLLVRLPKERLKVTEDTGEERRETPFLFVGNNVFGDNFDDLTHRKTLTGGVLDYVCVNSISPWKLLPMVWRATIERFQNSPEVTRKSVKELRIDAKRKKIEISIDGDRLKMSTPLQFRSLPKSLRIVRPKNP